VLLDAETEEQVVDGLLGYPKGRVAVRATAKGEAQICCAGQFKLVVKWSGRVKEWEVRVEHGIITTQTTSRPPKRQEAPQQLPRPPRLARPATTEEGGIQFCELVRVRDIQADPSVVPDGPGIYVWCFNKSPIPREFWKRCVVWEGRPVLYVGIAADQSLRDRIVKRHLRSASVSTLRLSLGCLLREKRGLRLRRTSSGGYHWGPGERTLTDWMADHAFVTWHPCGKPEALEADAITKFQPPLNINGNRHHPFCEHLVSLREQCKAEAEVCDY